MTTIKLICIVEIKERFLNMNKLKGDSNGFVLVEKRPMSKVGVFDYLGSSIGADEPDKIYRVYRPAKELSSKETIESFKLVPLIDDHEMLGVDGMPAEKKGVQGTTGENIYFDNDTLYGNLKVYSTALKTSIDNGKKELSLGYKCKYKFEDGIFNGEKYDAIQTELRGNHAAVVDEGRMGEEVSVCDSAIITFDNNDITGEIPKMKEDLIKALEELLNPLNDKLDALLSEKKVIEDTEEVKDADVEEVKDADMEEEKKAMAQDVMDTKISLKEEFKNRDKLVSELSPIIGAFDHLNMEFHEVVSYGIDKLEIKADKGHELSSLKGFLAGTKSVSGNVIAMDTKQNVAFVPSFDVFK